LSPPTILFFMRATASLTLLPAETRNNRRNRAKYRTWRRCNLQFPWCSWQYFVFSDRFKGQENEAA